MIDTAPPDPSPALTIAEVAAALHLSRGHVYRMARAGNLPGAARVGHVWRVDAHRLDAALFGDAEPACPAPDPSLETVTAATAARRLGISTKRLRLLVRTGMYSKSSGRLPWQIDPAELAELRGESPFRSDPGAGPLNPTTKELDR